ncbi:uncharacterized protein DMAD_13525 [Drosophila madeirensis]
MAKGQNPCPSLCWPLAVPKDNGSSAKGNAAPARRACNTDGATCKDITSKANICDYKEELQEEELQEEELQEKEP